MALAMVRHVQSVWQRPMVGKGYDAMMIRMLPSGQPWRATAKAHERFADFFTKLRTYAKKHGMTCAVDVNDTTATIKATHWHGLGLAVAITHDGEVHVKTVYA